MSAPTVLVVVPCGKAKVWDKYPGLGPTVARHAYTGTPFMLNSAYGEHFGDDWVILSARYGFLDPDDVIENYQVTFNDRATNPITTDELRTQRDRLGLDHDEVVALGGNEYRRRVLAVFGGRAVVRAPFAGMGIGAQQGAIKQALREGRPR